MDKRPKVESGLRHSRCPRGRQFGLVHMDFIKRAHTQITRLYFRRTCSNPFTEMVYLSSTGEPLMLEEALQTSNLKLCEIARSTFSLQLMLSELDRSTTVQVSRSDIDVSPISVMRLCSIKLGTISVMSLCNIEHGTISVLSFCKLDVRTIFLRLSGEVMTCCKI